MKKVIVDVDSGFNTKGMIRPLSVEAQNYSLNLYRCDACNDIFRISSWWMPTDLTEQVGPFDLLQITCQSTLRGAHSLESTISNGLEGTNESIHRLSHRPWRGHSIGNIYIPLKKGTYKLPTAWMIKREISNEIEKGIVVARFYGGKSGRWVIVVKDVEIDGSFSWNSVINNNFVCLSCQDDKLNKQFGLGKYELHLNEKDNDVFNL